MNASHDLSKRLKPAMTAMLPSVIDPPRAPSGRIPEAVSRLILAHLLMAGGRDGEAASELDAACRLAANSETVWLADLCAISRARLDATAPTRDRESPIGDHQDRIEFEQDPFVPASVKAKLRRLIGSVAGRPSVRQSLPRVRIYVLGRFGLVLDGKPIQFQRKTPKKTLELLKALIAYGGRSVSEERLAASLWPDSEGDAAQQALATTLHRLRKLIGDRSIDRRDGQLCLSAQEVWVDSWAFEQGLNDIGNTCRETDTSRLTDLVAHVLTLYRGHFLTGDPDYTWVLRARECLRSKFLHHLESAARVLTPKHPQRAIACYRKALEIEPLAEGLYRGLMRAHLARGHRAEALATYERCCRSLGAELGITPCAETQAVAKLAQSASGS